MRVPTWLLVLIWAACSGCLAGPTVTVTPANAAQAKTCALNADVHNAGWVVASVLGAGGAGIGTAATQVDSVNTQKTLAIVGIGVGVAAVGVTVVNAITAQEYATQHCTDLTGALPSP